MRAEAYQYDQLGHLTQVTYSNADGTIDPADKVVQYTYDADGNRLSMTTYAQGLAAGATQTLTYAYGADNRLLSVTDQNGVVQAQYFYDWRGNRVMMVTPTATTRYGYDSQNLLTSVDDGTNHIEYTYDGAGRRLAQSVNGVVTRFVVDISNPIYQTLEDLNSAGQVTDSYTYGLNNNPIRSPA
jgi:YD repeat-containing protein